MPTTHHQSEPINPFAVRPDEGRIIVSTVDGLRLSTPRIEQLRYEVAARVFDVVREHVMDLIGEIDPKDLADHIINEDTRCLGDWFKHAVLESAARRIAESMED